jgi:hypothetical protein
VGCLASELFSEQIELRDDEQRRLAEVSFALLAASCLC